MDRVKNEGEKKNKVFREKNIWTDDSFFLGEVRLRIYLNGLRVYNILELKNQKKKSPLEIPKHS